MIIRGYIKHSLEPEILNLKGDQESIPPAYVAWRACTIILFLLGS
jgi:hypothetical protein